MADLYKSQEAKPKVLNVVAVLETMWDWRQMTSGAGYNEAPRFFRINQNNFSGKRLYWLLSSDTAQLGTCVKLLVTNACRELVSGPQFHGKGDPAWLGENLNLLESARPESRNLDLLLVCGKIAQDTYAKCGYKPPETTRVIRLPHPAARLWSTDSLNRTRAIIQSHTGNFDISVNREGFHVVRCA
jgi:hypothetical protein